MRSYDRSRRFALSLGALALAQVLLASTARAGETQPGQAQSGETQASQAQSGEAQPPPPPRAPAQVPGPAASATATAPTATRLPHGDWRWLRSEYNNDTVVRAAFPDRYTIGLRANGDLAVRADCNRGFGSYILDGAALTIQPVAITRAACNPDSQDAVFLRDLGEVATYVFDGEMLVLNLRIDAGNMIFERIAISS